MNERISLSSVNIEVLLKLKQGRDEVKPEAVVTEYSDALVIPEAIVSELNLKIRELGNEKITGKDSSEGAAREWSTVVIVIVIFIS